MIAPSPSQLQRLRDIEAEQIRVFRLFMAHPELRRDFIRILATLKAEERKITEEAPYIPPELPQKKGYAHRTPNPARARYFQPGRA